MDLSDYLFDTLRTDGEFHRLSEMDNGRIGENAWLI